MKKLLLVVLSLVSVNAFATKARLIALGNSFHLVDEQFAYTNPMNLFFIGNLVSLETGLTTSTTVRNNAEGIISYGLSENSRIAVELGKNDDSITNQRAFINSRVGLATYMLPQNTVHLMYGVNDGEYVIYGGL